MYSKQTTLNYLPIGRNGKVTALTCDGPTRRRMLDLGIIEGTIVRSLYQSPSGNPKAYSIRGTVIALRSDVSEWITISMM